MNGRPVPVFSSVHPQWFIDASKDRVIGILKDLNEMNKGNCCIRPGTRPDTYAITSYIDGKVQNYSIQTDGNKYRLVLKEEQPWMSSLQEILMYYTSVCNKARPVEGYISESVYLEPDVQGQPDYYNTNNNESNNHRVPYVNGNQEPTFHYVPMGYRRHSDSSSGLRRPAEKRQSAPPAHDYINLPADGSRATNLNQSNNRKYRSS